MTVRLIVTMEEQDDMTLNMTVKGETHDPVTLHENGFAVFFHEQVLKIARGVLNGDIPFPKPVPQLLIDDGCKENDHAGKTVDKKMSYPIIMSSLTTLAISTTQLAFPALTWLSPFKFLSLGITITLIVQKLIVLWPSVARSWGIRTHKPTVEDWIDGIENKITDK